ncbi:MAG: hypothetical protein P9M08_13090 [Candidatus Erginobacter occultus]|nr:hypothetical protein [Candidatus Erginobacter occultus]
MRSVDGDELVECPHCGASTPSENLNCIYCGDRLPLPVGFISSLLAGWKGRAGIILIAAVLFVFLLWIL